MPEKPLWIGEAEYSYKPNSRRYSGETNFARGHFQTQVLQDLVLPNFTDRLRICEIGPGFKQRFSICPSEPYNIVAFLEQLKKDYNFVILDIDLIGLNYLRERQHVYIHTSDYDKIELVRLQWNQYLKDTEQRDELIYQEEQDLTIIESNRDTDGEIVFTKEILEKGFRKASVPFAFKLLLDTGSIQLVQNDIALLALETYGYFHFISATNVLQYLPTDGQKRALWNMVNALDTNGILLLNDDIFGEPLFVHQGGRMDSSHISELGLSLEKVFVHNDFGEWLALRKKG